MKLYGDEISGSHNNDWFTTELRCLHLLPDFVF